ncbi:MAG: hypothetical protein HXX80_06715 [Nitrososphaerales archaeon]|nr:hypothetical protein [Nitrososphaerales archaeon]
MEISPDRFLMGLGLFFLTTGVAWSSLAILREGTILLLEPGLVNIITGALLLTRFLIKYARAMVMASGLYSFVICAYQFYAASNLMQLGITTFTIASLIVYGLASLAFALVVAISLMNTKAFAPQLIGQTGDEKDHGP